MPTIRDIRLAGTRTRRVCSGRYEVSTPADPALTVTLDRRDDLGGWMAISGWDRHLYTDVVPTKAAAKFNAISMIEAAAHE
jgi:hypothetical protein